MIQPTLNSFSIVYPTHSSVLRCIMCNPSLGSRQISTDKSGWLCLCSRGEPGGELLTPRHLQENIEIFSWNIFRKPCSCWAAASWRDHRQTWCPPDRQPGWRSDWSAGRLLWDIQALIGQAHKLPPLVGIIVIKNIFRVRQNQLSFAIKNQLKAHTPPHRTFLAFNFVFIA